MPTLIVVTNATSAQQLAASRERRGPRLDYDELATRLGTRYLDFGAVSAPPPLAWLERRVSLDIALAVHAARLVRRAGYSAVFSYSERVALPLTPLLPRGVRHLVLGHHLTSPAKLRALRLVGAAQRWDRIFVPTSGDAALIRSRLGLGPDQVRLMLNTIDTEYYHPARATPGATADWIMALGLAHRDYPTLLAALAGLPHVCLQLGANSTWLGSQPGLSGALPPNVVLQPFLPDAALRDRYAACRFVVLALQHPTTHWSAGTNTVMQAAAMGKAVVATRNPGMEDYVRHGETGLLVDGGDPAALAGAIDHLWRNPDHAAAMGRRAREWAEASFAVDRWLERFGDLAGVTASGLAAA